MVVIVIPSLRLGGLKEFLSAKFGKSDSFTFLTIEDNAVKEVKVIQNPPMGEDGGFGIRAAKIIKEHGANELIVGIIGPNAFHTLNSLNIKIYESPNESISIKELLALYLEEKLQIIKSSNK